MFKNLDYYLKTIEDIKILLWWKFVQKRPVKIKQTSCVVALLLGTQPKGMQWNYSGICTLCNERQQESPEHILFSCSYYNALRNYHMKSIEFYMPRVMRLEYETMNISKKCQFLLSGLNDSYIEERNCLYSEIADFAWHLYKKRHQSYETASIQV